MGEQEKNQSRVFVAETVVFCRRTPFCLFWKGMEKQD